MSHRILQSLASTRADHGGTSRSVPAMCRALREQGADVHFVTTVPVPKCDENKPIFPGESVHLHLVEEKTFLQRLLRSPITFYRELDRTVQAASPTLLHDHGAWLPSNVSAAHVAYRRDLPLVISPRGMVTEWALQHHARKKRFAWHLYQKRVFAQADLFHVTARDEVDALRELGFQQPAAVIPNAVDVPSSLPDVTGGGQNRALFLSRIHPKKGLSVLLDAWARASTEGWTLEVVGPDEDGHRHELEHRAADLGIENAITFSGPVDDANKWMKYATADLFVLPSYSENFGIVVAEALAAGIPVITTTGTPWRELETHECGWWIELSTDALVAVLNEALTISPERRGEMGKRGRALIEEHYSWASVAKQMLSAYAWLLGEGPKPDCIFD